jgi:mono/diheme cytochrome c family protein
MTLRISVVSVIFLAASVVVPAFAQAPGADTYKAKCAMCHGADGLATSPMAKNMKVLSFKAPAMMKASDAQFIASTKNGKGAMKGYAGKLTDAQIKDVIAYVRTLQK